MRRLLSIVSHTAWHTRLFFSAYVLLLPTFISTLLPTMPDASPSIAIPAVLIAEVAAFLSLGIFSIKHPDIPSRDTLGPTTTCFLIVGTAPYAASAYGVHIPGLVLLACSVLLGFGKAIIFLMWAHVFSKLSLQKAMLYGCSVCLCAGTCAFIALGLRPEWIAAIALISPCLSIAAWYISMDLPEIVTAQSATHRSIRRMAYPWRPIAIISMAGFSAGAGTATSAAQSMTQQAIPLAIIGFLTLVCVLFLKGFRFEYVLKASIAGYILGFICLAIPSTTQIAGYLIFASYWGLCLFAFCILCKAAHDGPMPSAWLFGIGFSISEIIQLSGYFISRLPAFHISDDTEIPLLIAASLLLAIGMVFLWISEHSKVGQWAASRVSNNDLIRINSEDERVSLLCRRAAIAFRLTPREEEIAIILMNGKTVNEAAQELFVSQNTIKTHCKHIYAKANVHSRQELREAIMKNAD
jgi:DNA-binding CsgD family transcriptional regulator/uncharacterized membrane protein YagU involved in acid resistance